MNRFHSPQPNVPGLGILAGYTRRFWAVVVLVGTAAGIAAAGFLALLDATERLAWGHAGPGFLPAVKAASPAHHVGALLLAGVLAGVGGLAMRRMRGLGGGEISEAIWLGGGRLALLPSLARGVLSIVTVGVGSALGREAAPQLAGAAVASELCQLDAAAISAPQRKLLVACGAGAGMAAIYNVPLGGALFALEVLLGTLELPLVVPALLACLIATVVARVEVPAQATYLVALPGNFSIGELAWAAVAGPIAGLVAVAWVALVARVNALRPRGPGRLVAPIVVLGALGAAAIAYPELLGNGKEVTQIAFAGSLSVGLLAVLVVLRPVVTAACLGSGSPGGVFTPTIALGVLVGAFLGRACGLPDSSAFALIGGGAVLAAAMQGPLAATVLMLELTHSDGSLTVPLLLAVCGATIVARRVGGPSIYSARLASPPPDL